MENLKELNKGEYQDITGGFSPWPLVPLTLYLIDQRDKVWKGYVDTMTAILK